MYLSDYWSGSSPDLSSALYLMPGRVSVCFISRCLIFYVKYTFAEWVRSVGHIGYYHIDAPAGNLFSAKSITPATTKH